jgi:uncharacterized protein YjeT (DUF2065 family)
MMPIWMDLLRALALVMVIEGVLPFLSPGRARSTLGRLAGLDDRALRLIGLSSMIAGLVGLQLLRWFL